jgi:hypothetical protein
MIPVPILPDSGDADHYTRTLVRRLQDMFRDYSAEINKLSRRPLLIATRNGTDQNLTVNATDVLAWTTETLDTHGWFDTSTYRFTPKLPGYYQVMLLVEYNTGAALASGAFGISYVRLNGTNVGRSYWTAPGGLSGNTVPPCLAKVSCNGSTDYIDTAFQNTGTPTTPKLHGTVVDSRLEIHYLGPST